MRIMHIASGDKWAGAEVQVWTLCAELVRQQHDVYAIIMNPGRLASELENAGVNVTILDETHYSFWQLLGKIKAELRRVNPEVIHTHRQKENILGALANRLTIKAKSFRTVHGAPEFTPSAKQKVQIAADQFCGKYLQHGVISVDNELTEKLKGIYPADKIHTIANGISAQTVKDDSIAANLPDLDKQFTHIGIVGRLEPVKRVDLFIDTAAALLQDPACTIAIHFHIFGDGKLRRELEARCEKLQITEQVTFHGHTDVVRGWIAKLDLLVMTSDHEGLPMTALESLALGVPMVAHATGGLVPLLTQGGSKQGLVSHHSVNGYATACKTMLTNRPAVTLPTEFSAAQNAQGIAKIYQAV